MIRVRTYYKNGRDFFEVTLYNDEVILDNDKDLADFVNRKPVYDIYDNSVVLNDNEIVVGIDRNFDLYGYLYKDLNQTISSAIDNMESGAMFNHSHTDFKFEDVLEFEEEEF